MLSSFENKGNGATSELDAKKIRENIEKDVPNAVYLFMYDLSKGMARSNLILQLGGDSVEGIWHVGVYVFGREWSYSSKGVEKFPPLKDRSLCDYPERMERIGETFRSLPEIKEFIEELSRNLFQGRNYDILQHNCILFSHILCMILCGLSIPKYILDLPRTVIDKPLIMIWDALTTNPLSLVAPNFERVARLRKTAMILDNVPPSQMMSFLKGLPQHQTNPFLF